MDKKTGKVYLVGAGPGDPELITVKGSRILSAAEVLVYDRLASRELLCRVPEHCTKIYVGKEPGRHSKSQEEINRILVEQALLGKNVVRLKGGDPFVFGRGGEEIGELERCGIRYEVIPGVTSAIAALSHAGIPVTHRGVSQSFHVITGHREVKEHGREMQAEDFREYAGLSGTLIFLMGLSSLEQIAGGLLEGGKDPKTPAAVVTDGTTPKERCVRTTLSELVYEVKSAGLTSPGIIVVGEVAGFHMTWRKNLPLDSVSVGITGTEEMYEKLSQKFSEAGASVFRAGISHVKPCSEELLFKAVREISGFSWVVFTSRNGVRLFFEAIKRTNMDLRALGGVKFAAVGKGTADFLRQYGIKADYVPEIYETEALARGLVSMAERGQRLLIPRARQGSKVLAEILKEGGVSFLDLPVYDVRTEEVWEAGERLPDYITFESGSGVRGFFQDREEEKRKLLENGPCPVCIGRVTADVLRSYGISRILTAEDYTADGILEAIIKDRENG